MSEAKIMAAPKPATADRGPMPPPPQAVPKLSYRRLLRWSLLTVGTAPAAFALSTALALVLVLLTQYDVQLLANLISGVSRNAADDGALARTAIIFAVLAVLIIVLQFVSRAAAARADGLMLRGLQQRLHDRLLRMPPSYHSRVEIGGASAIVLQYSGGVQPLLRDFVAFPVVRGIGLVSALIYLFYNLATIGEAPALLQAVLALAMILLPLAGWYLSRIVRGAFGVAQRTQAALSKEFVNSASMPGEVRVLGAEAQRAKAFGARLEDNRAARLAATIRLELANQFQQAVPTLLQTGFLIYGVFAVLSGGGAAAGAILAIYYFVPSVISPVQELIHFVTGLNVAWPQVVPVGELLDAPDDDGRRTARLPPEAAGRIALDDVSLRFSADGPSVLDRLSYEFAPGQVTAIVGRSGSGKSSILSLIAALRPPDAGAVMVDGQPAMQVDPAALRAHIAVVSQFPMFISGSVRANMRLAAEDATDAEILDAARQTGFIEVIEALPQGLDTEIQRTPGQGFSGGQRRLLAVTRALIRRPKILLLDEPTTGIDAIGQQALLEALSRVRAGLTIVLVEHNLHFVQRLADIACCLEQGRFTDIGAPDDLASRPSLFQRLLASRENAMGMAPMTIESVALPLLSPGRRPSGETSILKSRTADVLR